MALNIIKLRCSGYQYLAITILHALLLMLITHRKKRSLQPSGVCPIKLVEKNEIMEKYFLTPV